MEIYLDYAATTRVSGGVRDIMLPLMEKDYGNPSSKHQKGMEAESHLRVAAEQIAAILKVSPKELIFTSGGTEANNLALLGTALAYRRAGNHMITTGFEHPSVNQPLLALKDFGFQIGFAPVDLLGKVKLDELLDMVTDQTILVSIMYVNNEIGAVQDIAGISKALKLKKKDLLLHVDAVQAIGKYPVLPRREGIDLMSASAHKICGPKGSGLLYVREKVKLKPLMLGGGQQGGYRSGTENVPAIAGFGQAMKEAYESLLLSRDIMYERKRYFIEKLLLLERVTVNAVKLDEAILQEDALRDTAPHIVSASFEGIKSEVLLHALEEKGIYVSSGSACASNHPGVSGTLKAIGIKNKLLDATLRFSLSPETQLEELDAVILALKELLPKLRRYTAR